MLSAAIAKASLPQRPPSGRAGTGLAYDLRRPVGPIHWACTDIAGLGKEKVKVRYFGGAAYMDFLTSTGVLSKDHVDGTYNGDPSLFVADEGKHGLSDSIVNDAVPIIRAELRRITKDSTEDAVKFINGMLDAIRKKIDSQR